MQRYHGEPDILTNRSFNSLANLAIAVAAVAIGSSVIYDTFFRAPARAGGIDPTAPPEYVQNWERLSQVGIRTGDSIAPVQIVEFADLECPACAKYEATLRRLMERHPGTVSRVFVHFPLEMHPYARRAAQAMECATDQGQFEAMLRGLYAAQLDFSTNPWMRLAIESQVGDTTRFARCLDSEREHPRIAQGAAIAQGLQLSGTPTILINGFLYPGSPQDSTLERAVRGFLAGKLPPGASARKSTRKVELD